MIAPSLLVDNLLYRTHTSCIVDAKLEISRIIKRDNFIVEIKIWNVSDVRYQDNLKYSLLCLDITTKKKVLFDNHHPKGDHYHINDEEFAYQLITKEKLIDDFLAMTREHLGIRIDLWEKN